MILERDATTREGAFADVFLDNTREKVIKLYKSRHHPSVEDRGKPEDELRRMLFKSEAEAYRITSSTDELREVTPKFYGVESVEAVARDGDDISDWYLLDCALEISFIPGSDVKYTAVRSEFPEVENMLHKHGISYTIDMSAFVNGEGSITVIDFAVDDTYHEHEMKWIAQDKL